MVTKFGMSDKLGTMYLGSDQEVFVGMEFGQTREYSEQTASAIDHEVHSILDKCYEEAVRILKEHIDQLRALGNLLIEKETLNRADFLSFLNGPEEAQPVPADGIVE